MFNSYPFIKLNFYRFIKSVYWFILSGLSFALAAPNATLTTNLNQNAFIGEQACFTAEFTNTSDDAGFGPYVLMILPASIDPATINATIFEGKSTLGITDLGEIDSSTNPIKEATDDYSGNTFSSPDGTRLVRITFPVGSLTKDSPPLDLTICATLPTTVTPNDLQTIQLTPAYRYGDSATGSTAIIGTPTDANKGLNPVLAIVKKENNAPENERTPGPNFPFTYTLAVDIANGQTLNNLNLTDALPANFQWTGNSASDISINNPACTVTTTPNIDPTPGDVVNSGDNPSGNLEITCNAVTGSTNSAHDPLRPNNINGGEDIIVNIMGYLTEMLDETTCNTTNIDNNVHLNAEYQSNNLAEQIAADRTGLTALPAAVQKRVNNTSPNPDNRLTYTLNFQITDYEQTIGSGNSASLFEIVDILPDGLTFDAASVVLSIDNATVAIAPTTSNDQGETTVTYDIANAAQVAGVALDASTTGRITYDAVVDQTYEGKGGQLGEPVNSNDPLVNTATLNYRIADNTSNTCTNSTRESVRIKRIVPNKEILNTSNTSTMPQPPYRAGDIVYYQIQMTIESGDAENVKMTDTLPLPVHLVSDIPTTLRVGLSANDTDPNNLVYHASLDNNTAGVTIDNFPPVVTTSSSGNSISFSFGDVSVAPTQPITLTVNIPAVVSDKPFADGLILANLLQISSENTQSEPTTDTGITDITTVAPDLTLTKGVLSSTGDGRISPDPAILPVNGNLTDADAGDSVTYRLTVENTGGASAFDVMISDTVPTELTGCSISSVTNGNGDNISYTDNSTSTQIDLTLSNNALGLGLGALAKNDDNPAGGGAPYAADTAFVDVTCTLANSVTPNQTIENTANVQWASRANSTKFPAKSDTATITIAQPSLAKSIFSVTPNATGSTDFSTVTAGDTVTYDILVTLPEGETNGLEIADTLPAGFDIQTVTLVTSSTNSNVLSNDFVGTVSITSQTNTPAELPITFGPVTVNPDNNADNNAFVVRVTALVDGTNSLNDGTPAQSKTNTVTLTYTGNPTNTTITDNATTSYVEPKLIVSKSATPINNIEPGDTVTYTITVQNTGTAPAYDIQVTDNLSSLGNLVDLNAITNTNITGVQAGFSCNYNDPAVTCNQNSGEKLDVGATATFTIEVTVSNNVYTGSTYTNTASAKGYSQEDDTNNARSETTDSDDVEVETSEPLAVSKTVTATSEDWTTGNQVAIGEIITYQIEYTLPEGITRARANNIFQDNLPTGFEYVGGTAKYRAIYDTNLSAANENPTTLYTTDTPITPDISNISGQPRRLRFNFGDITNRDRDANDEKIIFTFDVRVKNTNDNNRSNRKRNVAYILYRDANGVKHDERADKSVRIVEPNLNISKTACLSGTGPGSSPALPCTTTVQGGQAITFTVRVSNSVNSYVTRAWEPLIEDTLPAEYSNLSVTRATLTSAVTARDNVDISSCITTSTTSTTPPRHKLVLDGDENNCPPAQSGNDYLAPDESITIVYTAILDPSVNFEQVVTNTATVSASSLPNASNNAGAEDGERDGRGGVNDFTTMHSASITADKPSMTKTFDNDTLQIGEKTTVTIEISIPRGETQDFVVTDDLPAGLSYTGSPITITLPSSNFSADNSPSTSPAAGTDPLVFDFGNIQNTATTAQTLTIEYEVVVDNVIGNQRNTALTNTVTANYTGANATNLPTASDTITVYEPNLEMTKSIVTGATGSNAGDTVRYRLVIENTDPNGSAYRVDIRDVLPAELLGGNPTFDNRNLSISGTVTRNDNGNTLDANDMVITTTNNPNDTLSLPLVDMPPGSSVTVEYDAKLVNTAVTGSTVTNTLTATYNSKKDGSGRNSNDSKDDDDSNLNNYGEKTSKSLTLGANIALSKNLAAGQLNNQFTIGEEVIFDLKIDLSPGVTQNVELRDILPTGLTFVGLDRIIASQNITYTGSGTVSGTGTAADPIVITLGNVTNTPDAVATNDSIILQLRARVENNSNNQSGITLTNNATLTSNLKTLTSSTDIQLVEPNLSISKSVDNSQPSLGEEVTFTVEIKHQSGSGSDAFDIVMTDTLPTGLSFVPGSVTGPVSVDDSNVAKPIFTVSSLTLNDVSKSFTYRAKVSNTAVVGNNLRNSISGTYSSLTGDNANERDGEDGTGGLNDYVLSDDTTLTPRIVSTIDAKKTVTIVADNGTAGVADAGDTLEYTVTLKNEGTNPLTEVVFTDAIPDNTSLVANSLTTSTGTATEGDPIIVDGIASLAPNDIITITFRVTINAGTPVGTLIRNQGSVDSNETVPEPTDVDGVDANGDQPTDITVGGNPSNLVNPLYAEKTVELWNDTNGNGVVNPGDTLRYTLVLNNKGSTTLSNVSLTDTIPVGLSYVPASALASASNADVLVNGQDINWGTNTPMTIAPNNFVNLVFNVTVDDPLNDSRGDGDTDNETFANQADVNYTDNGTSKTTQTDSNGNPSDGNQPTTITATTGTGAPELDVQKRVALTVDTNGNGIVNPSDTLTYTVTIVNNGSAATVNARFSDSLPPQTTLVSGSVTSDYGAVTSGDNDPIEVNLGNLQPGEVATVRFSVKVNNATGGQTASNQASITGDNFSVTDSDDNGDVNDGINPTLTPIYDANNPVPTAVSKTIVNTSEASSTNNNVLIGEIVTYEVSIRLPSGTLSEASIIDILPEGLAYVAGSAKLKRVFTTGLNASANPENINTATSDDYINLTDGKTLQQTASTSNNTLSVFLGDVINSDTTSASYVLQYQAVVNNISRNTAGSDLTNAATLAYLTALNQPARLTPAEQTLKVTEPAISITKSAAPSVILTSGGTVTYEIEVKNNGTAPAYDVRISDSSLPNGWVITNTTLGTITNGHNLSATIASLSHIPPNNTQKITVTATAPSGLSEGATITNTVNATWTSLPGSNGTNDATTGDAGDDDGERTGASGSGSNGYTSSGSSDVKVATPSFTKSIRNAKARYAIGDVVEYQLSVTIPAGLNMDKAILTDVLDKGLEYITGSLNVDVNGLTLDAQPSDFTRSENTTTGEETLTFDTKGIENKANDARTLTLTYSARVENIIENQNGDFLDNNANVVYTNPGNANQTLEIKKDKKITIGEPHLALSKTITTPTTTNLDAGDSVTYQVTVSNDGTTTVFDTVLSDALPIGLENITALTIDSTTTNTLTRPTLTVSGSNNTVWTSSAFDLAVGESLTLTFTASLANSVKPGDLLQNTVAAVFTSQSGTNSNERGGGLTDVSDQDDNANTDPVNNYDVTTSAPTIIVSDPIQFDKAFNPTTKTTYTIGEIVTYRLTLQLAEGTLDDVVITDTLANGLTFIDGKVGFANTSITTTKAATISQAGQVITADLGQVINPANNRNDDDYLTVDIRARVDNILANQAGVELGNHARVTYTDANGAQTKDFDDDANTTGVQPLNLTLVEPNLTVDKTASVSSISLGDVVTFTINVAHDNSTATAYDIVVTDTLPAGMTYVANSATPTPTINGQVLTFNLASLTQASASTTIIYQARMNTNTAVGLAQTNRATMTYASQPNANGNADSGRNGKDGSGNLNDYTDDASTVVTPTANASIDAVKTVSISNDLDNDGVADVGDTLRYTVVLTNTGRNKVTNVVFTDTLPTNTSFGGNLIATGARSAAENSGVIIVNYDELVAGASVTIIFDVTIKAGTATGTVISNQGSVDSNQTVPEPTDVDGVDANGDQPTDIRVGGNRAPTNSLRAEKRVALLNDNDNNKFISPNDTLRYTIVLKNTGSQPLTNVTFNDTIPAGLTFINANPTSGSVTVNGQSLTWNNIADLSTANSQTLTFDVSINAFSSGVTSETFNNQGSADSNETDAVQTDSNSDVSDGNQPTTISATTNPATTPRLDVQKRVTLSDDINGNGIANPNDVLRYTINIMNTGAVTANDVRFTDTIPANTTLVAGSVTTSHGAIVNDNSSPIAINLGDLLVGKTATVSFEVRINANIANGTVIANQASIKPDNLNSPVLSDDNGDQSDGNNPTLTPVRDPQSPSSASIKKNIVTSSEADSTSNAVLIGEVVTFDIVVTLPIGNLRSASIVDTLPEGLRYISGSAQIKRNANAGLRASLNPDDINNAANDTFVTANSIEQSGRTLTVRLGDVINSSSTADDASYVLRYQAVVENLARVQDGTTLTNSATLRYLTGLDQPASLTSVNQTLTVREPAVTMKKSAIPTVILPTGGTVAFSVDITNIGNAPAYNVEVSDNMPLGWDLLDVTLPTGVTGIRDNSDLNASQVRLTIAKLDINQRLTVTYRAASPTSLNVGDQVMNTVQASWMSLPTTSSETRTGSGGINDYLTQNDAIVSVAKPQLHKTIRNPKTHYAIGDYIDYTVTLTLPAGFDMDNARIDDILSTGLRYDTGSLQLQANSLFLSMTQTDFIRVDNSPNAGEETLTLDVGRIYNAQNDTRELTLSYRAIVENVLSNQANTNVGNTVSVNFTDPGTGNSAPVLTSNTNTQIGEPKLVLTKAIVSPTLNLDAGDTLTYEVHVENAGTTSAIATVLNDTLPDGLTNVSNLTVIDANGVVAPTLTATNTGWYSDAFDLPVNATLTLRFTATLANSVQPDENIQNSVTAIFSSQSDTNRDARTGQLGDSADQNDDTVLNNYDVRATSPTFTVKNKVQIDKAFYPNAGKTTYRIGENVGYRVTISLQEGTLNNVRIADTLPAGLRFVSANVGFGNTGITTSKIITPKLTGQEITFSLGDIVNPSNGLSDDDFITVDVFAMVENIVANQNGTILGNHAKLVYQDGTGATVTVNYDAQANTAGIQPLNLTVVEPDLALRKEVTPTSVTLGDTMTFTLTLDHRAASKADAVDLVVTDTLPAGLTYIADSAIPAPTLINGQTLRFDVASLTKAKGQTQIKYRARLNLNSSLGQVLTNRASLTYHSIPNATGAIDSGRTGADGLSGALNDYIDNASVSVIPSNASFIEATKTVTHLDRNASGLVNIGDKLRYTVTLVNKGEDATKVIFTDPIPAHTNYVVGSLTTTNGSIDESDKMLRVEIDDLAKNDTVTISFEVTIASTAPVNSIIRNQGSVDSEQTVPELTDSDGINNNGNQPTDITVVPTPVPDMLVEKDVALTNDKNNDGNINPYDEVTYTITITNTDDKPLTNIVFSDDIPTGKMPAGIIVNEVISSKGTAPKPSNRIRITDIGTLAVSETMTIKATGTVNATVNSANTVVNQAGVYSNELGDVLSDGDGNPIMAHKLLPSSLLRMVYWLLR